MKKLTMYLMATAVLTSCGAEEPATNNTSTETPVDTTAAVPEETPAPVEETPVQTGPILGIDVSHFQGDVNWDEIKADTMTFGYAKATQGTGYTDPKFATNKSAITAAGLHAGAYHFYMAGESAEDQADHFVSVLGELSSGDMPPMLDLEGGGMKDGINIDDFQKNVMTWLTIVEEKTGMQPLIYTNHPFGNKYLNNAEFAKYDLWIAAYDVDAPEIPTAWADKGYTFWQRTSHATEEGVKGNVDQDIFKGTQEEFEALLKK